MFLYFQVQATVDGDYGWPPEVDVSDAVKDLVKVKEKNRFCFSPFPGFEVLFFQRTSSF